MRAKKEFDSNKDSIEFRKDLQERVRRGDLTQKQAQQLISKIRKTKNETKRK